MRRADRLFELLHLFRGGRLLTGRHIADRLGVNVRTIYRDIDSLVLAGVPIEGERGVGYVLREPIFLPPLTLKLRELEALHMGMEMVARAADEELAAAAKDVLVKIDAVLPSDRPRSGHDWGFVVYGEHTDTLGGQALITLRRALRQHEKLAITYMKLDGTQSLRTIRPLQVEYWGNKWTCTAWCDTRNDFRVFRVDRILSCKATGERFRSEPGKLLKDYVASLLEPGSKS